MSKKKISVMIVDDHSIIRDGVEQIINKTEDIQLLGSAQDPDEAIKILNNTHIDLAIVDLSMKGSLKGLDLVKAINERFPKTLSLVMSMHEESIYGMRAMKAGAKGYMMKDIASPKLIDAIHTIMNGELYISDTLQKQIVNQLIKGSDEKNAFSIEDLSNRELEVFELIGNGYSTKEISKKLSISSNTVESHRNRIKEKLNLKDSAELTKQAIQWIIMNK